MKKNLEMWIFWILFDFLQRNEEYRVENEFGTNLLGDEGPPILAINFRSCIFYPGLSNI